MRNTSELEVNLFHWTVFHRSFVRFSPRIRRMLYDSVVNSLRTNNISFVFNLERQAEPNNSSPRSPKMKSFFRPMKTMMIYRILRSSLFHQRKTDSKSIWAQKTRLWMEAMGKPPVLAAEHLSNAPTEINRKKTSWGHVDCLIVSLSCRGFVPVEIYKHHLSKDLQKRASQCQRCFLFKYVDEISRCEVSEDVYKNILSEIKRKRALIILLVDLLDLPNSISRSWAHLVDQTDGNKKASRNIVFVVGNKVDLLPKGRFVFWSRKTSAHCILVARRRRSEWLQWIENVLVLDSDSYLSNVRQCLENECEKRGLGKHLVKYYGLISARTGYGVEELISKIFRYWSQHGSIDCILVHFNRSSILSGGVYLLGGTNAGKSSLFNSLIDSDLCHIHALDCIQRATVSNLPGSHVRRARLVETILLAVCFRDNDERAAISYSTKNGKESISTCRTIERTRRQSDEFRSADRSDGESNDCDW